MLNDANNSVEWTAYKTTEKVPVKGKFTKVDVNRLKTRDEDPVSGSGSRFGALGPDLLKIFRIPLNKLLPDNLQVLFLVF